MAGSGTITQKDIITDKALRWGPVYAEGVKEAINANNEAVKTFVKIKALRESIGDVTHIKEYTKLQKEKLIITKEVHDLLLKGAKVRKSLLKEEKKQIEQVLVAKKEQDSVEKKLIKTIEQKKIATEGTNRAYAKERYELTQLNKRAKEAAVISSKLSTEYEKQAVKLTVLRRKYKDVVLTQGYTSKEAKRLRTEIQNLDNTLKRVDASVGQFQRNVGNYGKAMASASNAARTMASALGFTGGIYLFVQTMREAIGIVRGFEKSNATLSAILQLSRDEIKGLTEDAVKLGSTTVKTANEVTQLQIAYARLGFGQEAILKLTKSTISGSIAMNSELDKTADLVGAVVNTFDDLNESDASEIIDVMSLSTAKSALNFEKLQTGIPIVAGAANAAKIPFTRLVSLLGKLSDSGIDVSSSATAIRNIFIESAAQGLSYEEILEKIKGSQDKLTASNNEFGKRAAVSASILANNIDKTKELDETLQSAAGTAERMANKELDTLDGSIKLLSSAWEGYILSLDESSDSSTSLKNIISLLANNLDKILNTILFVTKGFAAYKIAVFLARVQSVLMNSQFLLMGQNSSLAAKGVNKTSLSFARFNKVLKANALSIAIGLVSGLVYVFNKLNRSVFETANDLHKANKEFITQAKETTSVNIELGKMADRYDELSNKTDLNAKEQQELNDIVKKISKTVPDAVTEINKYGNALEINTKKTRDFIKLQNSNTLLEAEINKKKQQLVLKELTNEQEKFNRVSEDENGVLIKGFGVIKKVNGALVKLSTIQQKSGGIRIIESKLTDEQTLAYGRYLEKVEESILQTKKDIQANEDVIASITGVKNARQKQTEVEEKAVKEAKELADKKKAEIRSVINLKEKIKALKEEQEGLTLADKARSKEINRKIKLYQDEIDQITGTTKAIKEASKEKEDALNLDITIRKQDIDSQLKVLQNQKLTLAQRIAANEAYTSKSIELLELEAKNAIEKNEGRANKIKEIELKLSVDKEKIEAQKEQNSLKILEDSFNARKAVIEKSKKKEESEVQKEIQAENDRFNALLQNESLSLKKREEAQRKHEEAIQKIKRDSAKKVLEEQIVLLEKELQNTANTNLQKKALEQLLSEAKIALSQHTTDAIIADTEKRRRDEAKLFEQKQEFIRTSSQGLAEALSIDEANLQNFLSNVLDGFGKGAEDIIQGMASVAGVVSDLFGSVHQSNIEAKEEEIRANDEYYNRLIEAAEGDEDRQELLRKEQEQKRKKLEDDKKKEQIKQAKFQKAAAIFQIGLNTAQAILGIWAQVPKFDFGVSAGVMTGIVGALGLAQAAAVASKPIPKYKTGRKGGKAEWAILGDGGEHEVQERKDGSIRISPNTDTLTWLEEGDTVHRNINAFLEEKQNSPDLLKSVVFGNLRDQNTKITNYYNQKAERITLNERILIDLLAETKRNSSILKSKKFSINVEDNSALLAGKIAHELDKKDVSNWG